MIFAYIEITFKVIKIPLIIQFVSSIVLLFAIVVPKGFNNRFYLLYIELTISIKMLALT